MKVLVVDDDRFLVETIQEILKNDGLEVMSACDGVDGYWTYLLFKPDVVITDIQMPRKNGLEMMKRIRIHNPMIKTIYISGSIAPFQSVSHRGKEEISGQFFRKTLLFRIIDAGRYGTGTQLTSQERNHTRLWKEKIIV